MEQVLLTWAMPGSEAVLKSWFKRAEEKIQSPVFHFAQQHKHLGM